MPKLMALLAAVAATLALGGCGSESGDATDNSGTTTTLDDLDGLTFVTTSPDDVEDPSHRLVDGTSIRISFDRTRVAAHAGCNHLSGEADLDGDTLVVAALAGTEMGCPPALAQQDEWLTGFLSSRPTLALADQVLTLSTTDTTIRLTEESEAVGEVPLEGTTWRLDMVIEGSDDEASASFGSHYGKATIRLGGGRIEVATGCNTGAGDVETADGHLRVDRLTLTRRHCGGSVGRLEQTVVSVLESAPSYELDGRTLTLRSSPGLALQYVAAG